MNVNDLAGLTTIQCNANGACSASGFYGTLQKADGTFVVNESQGTWQSAVTLPQSNLVAASDSIDPNDIACSSVGNCALVGSYESAPGVDNAFVANEIGGTWQNASEVYGVSQTGLVSAGLNAVSCPTNGNCSAAGSVSQGTNVQQPIVVSEQDGAWEPAQAIPGLDTLNVGNDANANTISCVSPGDCTTGGFYSDTATTGQAFTADQVNGTWSDAQELPGSGTINGGGNASIYTIVCAVDDSCVASGTYTDLSNNSQSMVDYIGSGVLRPLRAKAQSRVVVRRSRSACRYLVRPMTEEARSLATSTR